MLVKFNSFCNIELHMSRERNTLNAYFRKWEKLLSALCDYELATFLHYYLCHLLLHGFFMCICT